MSSGCDIFNISMMSSTQSAAIYREPTYDSNSHEKTIECTHFHNSAKIKVASKA